MEKLAFGPVLKDVRSHLGISQAELALRLESTQRHVSFLETGRSVPSHAFVIRICRELGLSVAQRANLFDASGHPNPYPARDFSSQDVTAALDMIEARVLANWPFPALVLDASWNVLRANGAFQTMLGPLMPEGNAPANLLATMLSPVFRALIINWEEAVGALYFRLQAAAAEDQQVAEIFAQARAAGTFDEMDLGNGEVPVFVPIEMQLPKGPRLSITSMIGKLASTQDALVEGFDIELMIPTDGASEAIMRAALG